VKGIGIDLLICSLFAAVVSPACVVARTEPRRPARSGHCHVCIMDRGLINDSLRRSVVSMAILDLEWPTVRLLSEEISRQRSALHSLLCPNAPAGLLAKLRQIWSARTILRYPVFAARMQQLRWQLTGHRCTRPVPQLVFERRRLESSIDALEQKLAAFVFSLDTLAIALHEPLVLQAMEHHARARRCQVVCHRLWRSTLWTAVPDATRATCAQGWGDAIDLTPEIIRHLAHVGFVPQSLRGPTHP
jgi:hypothetical protein